MFRSICFKSYTCDHNVLCTFKDDSPSHQPDYEVITIFQLTFHQIWSYISLALLVGVEHCTLVRKDFISPVRYLACLKEARFHDFSSNTKLTSSQNLHHVRVLTVWLLSVLHSDVFGECRKVQKIGFKKKRDKLFCSASHIASFP